MTCGEPEAVVDEGDLRPYLDDPLESQAWPHAADDERRNPPQPMAQPPELPKPGLEEGAQALRIDRHGVRGGAVEPVDQVHCIHLPAPGQMGDSDEAVILEDPEELERPLHRVAMLRPEVAAPRRVAGRDHERRAQRNEEQDECPALAPEDLQIPIAG